MTNPENQSTPLTLDEEQLKAITGGGAVMCCMRGTPVRPTPHAPDPVVVIHPAPAPEAVVHPAPAPGAPVPPGYINIGGELFMENYFSFPAGPSQASTSNHPGTSHH